MRRLPVYLVLDTSGSMMGEPIEALKNGLQLLVSSLRQDPYALETAYLSVITFGAEAQQVVPLTELTSFQTPNVSAGGQTPLGQALSLTAARIEQEVAKTTPDAKGDWKPIVFILTDGVPTDDWRRGVEDLRRAKTGLVVACAAGAGAETSVLKEITEIVVSLDTADSATMKAFFKWVSASISTSSKKVESGGEEVKGASELPPPPQEINVVL